jgi:hypothetical protein
VETLRAAAGLGFGAIFAREDVGGSQLTRLDGSIIFEALAGGCVQYTAVQPPAPLVAPEALIGVCACRCAAQMHQHGCLFDNPQHVRVDGEHTSRRLPPPPSRTERVTRAVCADRHLRVRGAAAEVAA